MPKEKEKFSFWHFRTQVSLASVLTIPAAGSEMSEASVITNEDGDVKLGYSNILREQP